MYPWLCRLNYKCISYANILLKCKYCIKCASTTTEIQEETPKVVCAIALQQLQHIKWKLADFDANKHESDAKAYKTTVLTCRSKDICFQAKIITTANKNALLSDTTSGDIYFTSSSSYRLHYVLGHLTVSSPPRRRAVRSPGNLAGGFI